MVQEKKDKALKREVGPEKFEKLKASYAIKKEERNLRSLLESDLKDEEDKNLRSLLENNTGNEQKEETEAKD